MPNFNRLLAEAERHFRDCPQDLRPISEIVKSFKPTEAKTDSAQSETSTGSTTTTSINEDPHLAYQDQLRRARNGRCMAGRIVELDFCSACGSTRGLQRHHKNGEPWDNAQSNIIVLCAKCHSACHQGTWRRA